MEGETLSFRNANVDDAAFTLLLRIDPEKSRYLSPVSGELVAQQEWLREYENLHDQAYFIIQFQDKPIGTVRLYDARGESFCWGSWILSDESPSHAAIESALMIYSYAVDHLKFKAAHFDVRKDNQKVWHFHERFGAERTAETELNYLYRIDYKSITTSRSRYQRFLASQVTVKHL